MATYQITLKNEKLAFYNRLGWLIVAGNIAFITYLAFFGLEKKVRVSAIATLILLTVVFLLYRYFKNSINRFGLHPFFLTLILTWILSGNYWMAGILFIFDLLHGLATKTPVVVISNKAVHYPSWPVKKIDWVTLNGLLLKDGLLTIDFKSDKLIQQAIDEAKTSVDEKEFNEFCNRMLMANG